MDDDKQRLDFDTINMRQQKEQQRLKWMQEREHEKELEKLGIKDQINEIGQNANNKGGQQILTELTMKITERFKNETAHLHPQKQQQQDLQQIKLEKTISKELEQNSCGICYELMVPPKYSPILLFPCGHTLCKDCVYGKSELKKLNKCPFCRQKIQSSAINISLQNLICIYTNNKHLLDKFKEEDFDKIQNQQQKASHNDEENSDENQNDFKEKYEIYRLRCKILEEEKQEILNQIKKHDNEVKTYQTVVDKLNKQKYDCEDKIRKLQEEIKLINTYVHTNIEQMQIQKSQLEENQMKISLIEETLKPLQMERQKYQVILQTFKKN